MRLSAMFWNAVAVTASDAQTSRDQSRLLPNIRLGTQRYPEKVARRLRALNLAAWIAAAVYAAYSTAQFMDPNPGMWKPTTTNAVAAFALSLAPLLHRFGPLAGPIGLTIIAYTAIFVDCALFGIGNGMQMYYLVAASLGVLFLGTDCILLPRQSVLWLQC
jgi:adenylate cyclase